MDLALLLIRKIKESIMAFKQIIIFPIKEYNNNSSKNGYYPQKGTIINVFVNSLGMNAVAVGFD